MTTRAPAVLKKTKLQNKEIVQVVSGQFSKGYCREGGHTGRGSCRFLPVSLFTHLGMYLCFKHIIKRMTVKAYLREVA